MNRILRYFSNCLQELQKVTWPTGKSVLSSTRVVVFSVIIVSVILGFADFLLMKGFDSLLSLLQ